jgi:hypothetical protein
MVAILSSEHREKGIQLLCGELLMSEGDDGKQIFNAS